MKTTQQTQNKQMQNKTINVLVKLQSKESDLCFTNVFGQVYFFNKTKQSKNQTFVFAYVFGL